MSATERERLIVEHLPLVRGLARRYANRGEPLDDLVQVGTIGLIKAIDRFDATRGVKLASFATPTILGEIRRHFRDRSWTVRVPRGIQEARAQITHAVSELSAANGRSPSVREIAEATGLSTDDVLDALAAGSAQRPASLSAAGADGEDEGAIAVGTEDAGFAQAEARATLDAGLAGLPAARARDPAPALRGGPHPVPDRRAGRHLPDARLAAHPARDRGAARGHPWRRRPRGVVMRVSRSLRAGTPMAWAGRGQSRRDPPRGPGDPG